MTYNQSEKLSHFDYRKLQEMGRVRCVPLLCVLNTKEKKRGGRRSAHVDLKKELPVLLAAACAVCLLLAGASFLIGGEGDGAAMPEMRILRVMTSNDNTCMPLDGEYLDWVEVANLSAQPVDLKGWRLYSGIDVRSGYVFPQKVLQPGESAIVYAGGQYASYYKGDAAVANFTLSADGVSLTLMNADNVACNSLDVPALAAGEVYALKNGEYVHCSPYEDLGAGLDLTEDLTPRYGGGVVISELMALNGSYIKDSAGQYSDWIEIYNGTGDAVNLAGYSLSEDETNRCRFVFPNVTLNPGEYKLVFASGGERAGSELHAAFKLSNEGERVVLFDAMGKAVSYIDYENLDADQSVVRQSDGSLSKTYMASPGQPNTRDGARSAIDPAYFAVETNALGLYINEVVCESDRKSDWVELINESGQPIDLTGFGLSDNPNRPRKWQFPAGTTVPAGGGLVVSLIGSNGDINTAISPYVANFALDLNSDESLVLADAHGEIIDRMLITEQRMDVSYGRASGESAYVYFTNPTPGAPNAGQYYRSCAREVEFSHLGGVQSGPVQLTLSAEPGMTIYYTLDGSEPSAASNVYAGPLDISSNTVVKAIAWNNNAIPSYARANTYIFGVSHTVPIVCVSGNSSSLTGSNGVLNTGEIGGGQNVYTEIYDAQGNQIISQGSFFKINGKSSRLQFDQKSFRLVAKDMFGDNRFRAELFADRDYDEYKAVVVRAAGQDNKTAFMRDVIFTSRAKNTSVMYQESEVVVAYVNGQFWGAYHLRERISPESISQFEGWSNPDAIDLLESNSYGAVQGSNTDFKNMMAAVAEHGVASDENLAALRQMVDVENYLEYVILQMYCCNPDLNNLRIYRNTEEDGLWRWILFDTDLGFRNPREYVTEWFKDGGYVGAITQQSNELFLALMQNPTARDWFLTRFGELLATDLSGPAVVADIIDVYSKLAPEMELHCQRWNWNVNTWDKAVTSLINRLEKRPAEIVAALAGQLNLSSDQVQHYFGEAMAKAGM